jgi:hypothetical protein
MHEDGKETSYFEPNDVTVRRDRTETFGEEQFRRDQMNKVVYELMWRYQNDR